VLIPRRVWGAKPLTAYSNKVPHSYRTGIIIHHSVTPEGTSRQQVQAILRQIDDGDRRQGYGGIGYNLAVDYAGRIYRARGIGVLGAHAGDANGRNFGVCYIGDGRKRITPEAVRAIRKTVDLLTRKAGHRLTIMGHQDVNATACPGPTIQRLVDNGSFR
jgi:predicted amino acid racemase